MLASQHKLVKLKVCVLASTKYCSETSQLPGSSQSPRQLLSLRAFAESCIQAKTLKTRVWNRQILKSLSGPHSADFYPMNHLLASLHKALNTGIHIPPAFQNTKLALLRILQHMLIGGESLNYLGLIISPCLSSGHQKEIHHLTSELILQKTVPIKQDLPSHQHITPEEPTPEEHQRIFYPDIRAARQQC